MREEGACIYGIPGIHNNFPEEREEMEAGRVGINKERKKKDIN